jgi:polysaccharide export outer membrane protein
MYEIEKMDSKNRFVKVFVTLSWAAGIFAFNAIASDGDYLIQASDILTISVWKEEDLQAEVLVRPDGKFSFPLAGEIVAASQTIEQVRADVVAKIEKYIPDPVVTVTLRQSLGNRIFVLGKVLRPGEFPLTQDLDVMQALALGGGLVTFADANEISILRRTNGEQVAIPFNYQEASYGTNLGQNVLLQPGDVVVVP